MINNSILEETDCQKDRLDHKRRDFIQYAKLERVWRDIGRRRGI